MSNVLELIGLKVRKPKTDKQGGTEDADSGSLADMSTNSAPRPLKRVALLIATGRAFDRGIAKGIGDYVRNHRRWVVFMDPERPITREALIHWGVDGIIADVNGRGFREALTIPGIPLLGVGAYNHAHSVAPGVPVVGSNQYEAGRMAAQHLIDQGYHHLAFCGDDLRTEPMWCRERWEGFRACAEAHGKQCHRHEPQFETLPSMPQSLAALGAWLQRLPKPVGVFAFYDGKARAVLDACLLDGIKVPQAVGVIGVDNDLWLCELAQPGLTSIEADARGAGALAAQLMSRMLDGETLAQRLYRIEPTGVTERESTDLMAFFDPGIAYAIRFIRAHACDPIKPEDVLRASGMSVSTAYRKFKKAFGRSVHEEIQRLQLDRVKELLTTTNLPIATVARRAGFENIRYLTKLFRDNAGVTPREFRQLNTRQPGDAGRAVTVVN
jgi:LacI family transcriptional regulator